jgi:hypothetical protein
MRLNRFGALPLILLLTTATNIATQQNTDPVTGTWSGDWGPSATDRNAVKLELKWDGKTLTGIVNPGPDAIPMENASFDPQTSKIHIEANYVPRSRRYVMDGTVENGKMSGTWNHPSRTGDFQLSIERQQVQSDPDPKPIFAGLNDDDRKVVDYLLQDWGEWEDDFSITSVDIAIDVLRIPASSETRFRIGNYIKNNPELHEIVRSWGWQTIVLTPTEKLVARAIVNAQRDKQPTPARSDIAKLTGISERETDDAVGTLSRYGILKSDPSAGGIGYAATDQRYVNWQPWLDFQFHRITLSSGRTAAVN